LKPVTNSPKRIVTESTPLPRGSGTTSTTSALGGVVSKFCRPGEPAGGSGRQLFASSPYEPEFARASDGPRPSGGTGQGAVSW
jgi:hypothetical protein